MPDVPVPEVPIFELLCQLSGKHCPKSRPRKDCNSKQDSGMPNLSTALLQADEDKQSFPAAGQVLRPPIALLALCPNQRRLVDA